MDEAIQRIVWSEVAPRYVKSGGASKPQAAAPPPPPLIFRKMGRWSDRWVAASTAQRRPAWAARNDIDHGRADVAAVCAFVSLQPPRFSARSAPRRET
jgi:hypothetical protein